MAIDRTETTAGAPPCHGGLTAKKELSCSREEWRPSGRQGKKVVTTLLRQSGRGAAGLRPDQAIEEAVWSGLDTGTRRRHGRACTRQDRPDQTTPAIRTPRPGPCAESNPICTTGIASNGFRTRPTIRGRHSSALNTAADRASGRSAAGETDPPPHLLTGRQAQHPYLTFHERCPAFSREQGPHPQCRWPPCLQPAERP